MKEKIRFLEWPSPLSMCPVRHQLLRHVGDDFSQTEERHPDYTPWLSLKDQDSAYLQWPLRQVEALQLMTLPLVHCWSFQGKGVVLILCQFWVPLIEATLVENIDSHDNRMFPDPHNELENIRAPKIESNYYSSVMLCVAWHWTRLSVKFAQTFWGLYVAPKNKL